MPSNEELNNIIPTLLTDSMKGIHGMPYQWMETVDRRINNPKGGNTDFGRKYAEKIVARMPILYLTPGRPSFMGDFSDMSKNNGIDMLISGAMSTDAEKILGSDKIGKYYSFEFAYDQYYSFVNPMCQIMSKLMNVDQYKIKLGKKTVKLKNADWSKAMSDEFDRYFYSSSSVPFYLDSEVTVSESFDNETTDSFLAGQAKQMQDQVRELDFLMGNMAGKSVDFSGLAEGVGGALNKLASFSDSTKSIMTKLTSSMASIATGGKLMFPQIWSDGSLSRSYSVSIKLRSPDCDNLSLYLNIVVPFMHLMAFVAPQMMWNNMNAYSAPFLVRAFYRSMFNIDMGIITSMNVSKGKEGGWNVNGIPTEMDISLTIKDLYDTFSISGFSDSTGIAETIKSIFGGAGNDSVVRMLKNTAMMDYMSNLAGLNINQPFANRAVEIYNMLKGNQVAEYPQRKLLQLQQAVDNALNNIYRPH